MLYFKILKSFNKLEILLFIENSANLEIISCNVPNGQTLGTINSAKSKVKIRTIINPVARGENWLKKFILEGTN